MGFPGRKLDSVEFQARAKLNEVLAEFAGLVADPMSLMSPPIAGRVGAVLKQFGQMARAATPA